MSSKIQILKREIPKMEKELKQYKKADYRYVETQKRIQAYKGSLEIIESKAKDELKKYKKMINKFDASSTNENKFYSLDIPKPKYISWAKVIELLNYTDTHFKVLNVGNVNYTLSDEAKPKLIKRLKKGGEVLAQAGTGSDAEVHYEILQDNFTSLKVSNNPKNFVKQIREVNKMKKSLFKKQRKSKKVGGGKMFKYTHNLDLLDLSRYQIYNKLDSNSNLEVCFINCMIQSKLFEEHEINRAKNIIKTDRVRTKDLEQLAIKLNFKLMIGIYDIDTKTSNYYKYNDIDFVPTLKVNLVDEHYFINDNKTNITSYALEHYDELKNVKDFHKITGIQKNGSYKRYDNRYISSLELVKYLYEHKDKLLKKIDQSSFKRNQVKQVEINNLEYTYEQTQSIEYVEKEDLDNKEWDHIYLDFETCTKDDEGNNLKTHLPYQICATRKEEKFYFEGEDCGLNLLYKIKKNSVLYAHNFKYDLNFIFKYTICDSVCERDGRFITGTSKFYNKYSGKTYEIRYRDTYHMIGGALKDFQKKFDIKNMTKDVIPYYIYTPTSIKLDDYSIDKALKDINLKDDEDRTQFLKNIKDWNLETKKGYFNHMQYSKIYCAQDVHIMKTGYETFKKWMKEITGLNICNYSTISSIAYHYGVKEGCFDGCFNVSGSPRLFIEKCVVGGRTMCNDNVSSETFERVQDFDGVSLYPSAMSQMGFLKGKPKILKEDQLLYDIIKNFDGYFIEIDIKDVKKEYKFPLLSKVNDKTGVREFLNSHRGSYYVDKISLEDLIEYHHIDFDIIRGYYFDEGKNFKIKETITYLFNERVKQKKLKNPIQEVYKLLMNSIYGKTLLKFDPKEIRYISNEEDALGYVCRNYDYLNNYNKLNDCQKYRIQSIKTIDEHFSAPQIGCEILSMSKRIMNSVMCLAEDEGCTMLYQDTDSIHILEKDIDKLDKAYFKKYRKNLIGKDLCQFHCDFDFKHDDGKDPVSVHNITVSKKTYIDKVECIRDNKIVYEYHMRLKGIPNRCILHKIKSDYNNDPMALYKDMKNNIEIEFDLLCDSSKPMFQFNKDYTVNSKNEFKRKFKLDREVIEEDDANDEE
jgi:hypothetical protein